jgi:hypothetical protein
MPYEYKVLTVSGQYAETAEKAFNKIVTQYINAGWILQGGVSINSETTENDKVTYAQAVVRKIENPNITK